MNQPNETLGKRRYVRLPVSLPVIGRAVQFPGEEIRGMIRNVSAGGMMAELPVEMVPGSSMDLALQTRWGPLEVEGTVVWTSASEGKIFHGVAFPEPKGQDFAVDLFVAESR